MLTCYFPGTSQWCQPIGSGVKGFRDQLRGLGWRFSPGGQTVENLPAKAGVTGDMGSIPGSGRYSGGGNGNPLQYSFLDNPIDRGAWWATVHGVKKSQT